MSNLPMPQPPQQVRPDEEMLKELGLAPSEFADFYQAFEIVRLMIMGSSITQACDTVGINRRSFYGEKWQRLIQKAQSMVLRESMTGVRGSLNFLAEKWPEIIRQQVTDALYALEAKDRNASTRLLYEMFPQLSQNTASDESAEASYLKSNHNFSPHAPLLNAIQVNAGATVNITTQGEIVNVE